MNDSASVGFPIIEAIAAVLGIASQHVEGRWCDGPEDERFFLADYRRNEASFKALWALGEAHAPAHDTGNEFLDLFKGKRATIILVDQDANQPVIPGDRIGRFVGALTWAHAFLFALERRQHNSLPRIGILDLRGRNDADAWAYSRFRTTPGISYFRGVGEMDLFANWLRDVKETSGAYRATSNSDFSAELELALHMWSVGVGWSNDRASHHEINNLAGPLALAASCPDPSKREILDAHNELSGEVGPRRLAAAAMMRAVDWFGEYPSFLLKPQLQRSDISFILLDDQYKHWGPILNAALGREPKSLVDGAITSAAVTRSFLDVIRRFVGESEVTGVRRPLRGKLYFSAPSEIMFLDLRLFSKDESLQEAEFFERILDIAKAALQSGVLCTDAIRIDLDIVATWLKSSTRPINTEATEYLRALSLFPQLLASLDDTYPIILFSSTRQRLISDRLKPYGNIIQCLSKPSFSAYSESHVGRTFSENLGEALLCAEKYLRLRRQIDNLSKLTKEEANSLYIDSAHLVEVFFDEAEDQDRKWVQAALIVEYATDDIRASELTAQWMREQQIMLADAQGNAKKRRIRWGSAENFLDKKLRVDGTGKTKPTVATWTNLENILEKMRECPHVASLHVLTLRIPKHELAAERRGYIDGCDPNFYASLRLLTESILFDLLGAANKVSLRFATRVLPIDGTRRATLEQWYGFSYGDFSSKSTLRVLPSRVAHGIVDSSRQKRPTQYEPKIVCCDARQISITDRCPNSEASSELHHLADLFATRALDKGSAIAESLSHYSKWSTYLAETSYVALETATRVASRLQHACANATTSADAWREFFESGLSEMELGSVGKIVGARLMDSLSDLESHEISVLALLQDRA